MRYTNTGIYLYIYILLNAIRLPNVIFINDAHVHVQTKLTDLVVVPCI